MSMNDYYPASGPLPTKRFVYVSRAADGLTIDAVRDLVFHARHANALDGLHGLLSFDRRGFLQVLEGAAGAVDELLAKIARDPRHCDLQVLLIEPGGEPMFHSFADILCEGDAVASLDMLHPRKLATLSGALVGTIGHGYAMLDQRA